MAETARSIGEQAGDLARSVRGVIGSKAEEIGDQSLKKSAELAGKLGDKTGELADRLDGTSQSLSEHVRGVADKVNRFADDLNEKNASGLLESAAHFGRAHPLMMMAAAGLLGFALARLVGSGASSPSRES